MDGTAAGGLLTLLLQAAVLFLVAVEVPSSACRGAPTSPRRSSARLAPTSSTVGMARAEAVGARAPCHLGFSREPAMPLDLKDSRADGKTASLL
jgi:hypothetical protein